MMRHIVDRLRPWRARDGQSMVLFALMLPVLAALTGLVIDAGVLYFQRRHVQTIADAAALTGAQVANFNDMAPAILTPEGPDQALANAYWNGAIIGEVSVSVPPESPVARYYRGDMASFMPLTYIEVHVQRSVPNAFMGLFGTPETRIGATAIARCLKPGYGDPAVLAFSSRPDAITFNGGGGSSVQIVGDVLTNGGIDANGNAGNFQIDGAAYSMSQPATTNITTTNGSYGTDSGVDLLGVADPITQGMYAQPPTVVWPYELQEPISLPYGKLRACTDGDYPPASGDFCKDGITPVREDSGSKGTITVRSNEKATLSSGLYNKVVVRGKAKLLGSGGPLDSVAGLFSMQTLDLGASAALIDSPEGVLLQIRGPSGLQLDAAGNVTFKLHAIPDNTWRNITIWMLHGDIDLTGTGDREIYGSIYAPEGNVAISGDGSGAVVFGQVIADTVTLSGNGPVVQYSTDGSKGNFGPILVNAPN